MFHKVSSLTVEEKQKPTYQKRKTQTQNPKRHIPNQKFKLTITSDSSLQLHINTGQNSGFNSPLWDSLCSVSYRLHVPFQTNKRRKKENPKEAQKKKKPWKLKNFIRSLLFSPNLGDLPEDYMALILGIEVALELWSSSSKSVRWLY